MPIPTWSPGEVLASADVNQWFVPLAAITSADDTAVLNTTLVNEPTLFLPVVAAGVYEFRLNLTYSGSVTGGFKYAFTVPAGTTGYYGWINLNAGGGPSSGAQNPITSANTFTIATLNALYYVTHYGQFTVGGTVGNLQLQYAENALDATHGSFIRAGSLLTAQRIG